MAFRPVNPDPEDLRKVTEPGPVEGSTRGRPREHDRETLAQEIVDRMCRGELVRDICADLGLTPETPFKWTQEDLVFRKAYHSARICQAHAFAERILLIADGTDELSLTWRRAIERLGEELERENDENIKAGGKAVHENIQGLLRTLEANRIQRDKLRVTALMWYTSKLAPKIYGDKLDLTSGGEALKPAQTMVVQFIAPGQEAPQLTAGPTGPVKTTPPPDVEYVPTKKVASG